MSKPAAISAPSRKSRERECAGWASWGRRGVAAHAVQHLQDAGSCPGRPDGAIAPGDFRDGALGRRAHQAGLFLYLEALLELLDHGRELLDRLVAQIAALADRLEDALLRAQRRPQLLVEA